MSESQCYDLECSYLSQTKVAPCSHSSNLSCGWLKMQMSRSQYTEKIVMSYSLKDFLYNNNNNNQQQHEGGQR